MPGIKHIKELLDEYPEIKYKATDLNISVLPVDENGFEVNFVFHAEGITVYYDGWHEEFDSVDKALRCFLYGLSSDCRLLVTARGDYRYKWIMEDSETSLLIFPFWRKKREFTVQNKHIKDSAQLEEMFKVFQSGE